jgi:FHS family glucose/mannose:H+ symporter-like MFS transporter
MNNSTSWFIVFCGFFCMFSLALLDNIRGPFLADIMRDLSLSDLKGSFLYIASSALAFVSARYVITLRDKFGLLGMARIGLFVLAAGFASISFSSSFFSMIFFAGLFGLGLGIINVGLNFFVLEGASHSHRRQLFSALHSIYAASSLLGPMIASELFRRGYSWQKGFVVASALVLIAFVFTFFGKEKHRHHIKEEELPDPARIRPQGDDTVAGWVFGVIINFYVMAEIMVSSRLALILRREYNYEPAAASDWLAIFFVSMLVGRLIFSIFSFKRFTNYGILLWALSSTWILVIVGLYVNPLALAFTGFTMGPIFAIGMDLVANKFPHTNRVVITNMLMWGSLMIVSMHFIFGFVSDWLGLRAAMTLAPVTISVAIVLLLVFKRRLA